MSYSTGRRYTTLSALFFLNAHALGMWSVNLSSVLKAHGFENLIPYIFAGNSIAALVSPLAIGTLADERVQPERILRWLGLGAAFFLCIFFYGIEKQWNPLLILFLGFIHALWSGPTFGLTTSLILSRLEDPQGQFGRVRLWATIGWMAAGWMVSLVLQADRSTLSGYASALVWLCTVVFTYTLPPTVMTVEKRRRSVKEMLGLNGLHLLRHPDHKVVFITAGLLNMALAAFYPFTVLHLEDLGFKHYTAIMSIGQITEIIAMMWLSSVLIKIRLKWVFLAGIGFGVIRYVLFVMNTQASMIWGIFLHGFCFTLFFITAQIYLEQRIPSNMRARAQALLTLVMNGFGNLVGYLIFGWWRQWCQDGGGYTHWPMFWSGLTVITTGVFIFFSLAYKGSENKTTPNALKNS